MLVTYVDYTKKYRDAMLMHVVVGTQASSTKMHEVTRRLSLVERRVMEQDNDFADSRIMTTRAEGRISALQGRQVQLEANVSETDM